MVFTSTKKFVRRLMQIKMVLSTFFFSFLLNPVVLMVGRPWKTSNRPESHSCVTCAIQDVVNRERKCIYHWLSMFTGHSQKYATFEHTRTTYYVSGDYLTRVRRTQHPQTKMAECLKVRAYASRGELCKTSAQNSILVRGKKYSKR